MKFSLPVSVQPQVMHVEQQVNALRKVANLPPRKVYSTKTEHSISYLASPDPANVSGIRKGRGFTYLNLNGGDSWGYWHPDDNFEFIFNFKGEPVYKTSELSPSYYVERLKEKRKLLTGVRDYYTFRDPVTDVYYAGWHDPNTNAYDFHPVSSKAKLVDFKAQFALPPDKIIHDWKCVFDPQSTLQVDPKAQYWNRFVPSKYMTKLTPQPMPQLIETVIRHVLGPTDEVYRAFINWLAFAFQYRRATGTAWILQGVPGTGKGILVNHIIKPLFGATNYTARRMEELEDKFNGYLEGCLICYIDEVHIGVSKRADMILANLKNQITEPSITIRNMRQMAYEVPNYLNWIMSSNMHEPIQLDKEDRRFNVGTYQKRPIRDIFPDTTALVSSLDSELELFAAYLATYAVDKDAVRIPVRSEARQDLIDASRTSLDVVGDAILAGDLALLASFISVEHETMMQIKGDAYATLIKEIAKTGRNKLTRDELRTIFLYTVGDVPQTPAKFTRFMNHRGIKLKKVRIGDATPTGIEVEWVITDELRREILTGTVVPYLKVVPDDGLSGIQRSDG